MANSSIGGSGFSYASSAGIIGPIVSGAFTLGGLALQQKYNKQLADIQNQYNIDMWNRQNEYNSPQAQMQRFSEAGLNPNLIYGQGTNGNSTSAPVQVAPEPVHADKAMQELGRAFNIQNLMINGAKIRQAIADAKVAEVNAQRERDHYMADRAFGEQYEFDDKTGTFRKFAEVDEHGNPIVQVIRDPAVRYYKMQHQADNFTKNFLLRNRNELINAQYRYLDPQIRMADYDAKYYPYSYWIGQGSKALQGIGSAVGMFYPKNWIRKSGGTYKAPSGRIYYY